MTGQDHRAGPTTLAADRLTEALLGAQDAAGGWAMYAGRPANTECTALAGRALAWSARSPLAREHASPLAARAAAAADRGLGWLDARQRPDGSWSATGQVNEPSWMSALALLALARSGHEPARVRRAAAWLVRRHGVETPWRERLAERWRRWFGGEVVNDLDATIPGWPWADATFAWVEPTAHALLALRAAAHADPALARDGELAARVRDGERLLVDRMTPGGGWNYGNVRVYGEALEPYPDTTAWGLLALAGAADVPRAVVTASIARLHALLAATTSPLARALAVLALAAHRQPVADLAETLASSVMAGPPPTDTRTRALALLALHTPADFTSHPLLGAPRA